jgi:hypothetical protein
LRRAVVRKTLVKRQQADDHLLGAIALDFAGGDKRRILRGDICGHGWAMQRTR